MQDLAQNTIIVKTNIYNRVCYENEKSTLTLF